MLKLIIHSFIHSAVRVMTGPMPPPKRSLHIMQFKASSFRWEYPPPSLRSSSNLLRLLPPLLVTSISPFIFPSTTCRIRQFLRSMWPIQLAFRFLISCRIFRSSLTVSNTSNETIRIQKHKTFHHIYNKSNERINFVIPNYIIHLICNSTKKYKILIYYMNYIIT